MNSHPTDEELARYHYGECTEDSHIEIDRHLTGCEPCKLRVQGLQAVAAQLDLWQLPESGESQGRPRSSVSLVRLGPALALASAACVLIGATIGVASYFLGKQSAPSHAELHTLRQQVAELAELRTDESRSIQEDASNHQLAEYVVALRDEVRARDEESRRLLERMESRQLLWRQDLETLALTASEEFRRRDKELLQLVAAENTPSTNH